MSDYFPDRWVILKTTNPESDPPGFYKIFSGWKGSWTNGDAWRLSSGITEIIDCGEYYSIENESGSVYACHKESIGMTLYMHGIYEMMKEQTATLEIVPLDAVPVAIKVQP